MKFRIDLLMNGNGTPAVSLELEPPAEMTERLAPHIALDVRAEAYLGSFGPNEILIRLTRIM